MPAMKVSLPPPPARAFVPAPSRNVSFPLVPMTFSMLVNVSLLAALPDPPPEVVSLTRSILIAVLKAE